MNCVVLPTLVVCAVLAALLLRPAKAETTELESIYVRVPISPQRYARWLASPLRHPREFDDWSQMNEQMGDDYHEYLYDWEDMTNGALAAVRENEMTCREWDDGWSTRPYINYDRSRGLFTYAQLLYDENLVNFTNDVSAYRTLADFKDTDEPGFIVIYPFLWDPGYTVIMEIGKGCTKFHTEATAPTEFACFIEEANRHFRAELDT